MSDPRHYEVVVIGAGFCGTMVAVHLARLLPGVKLALVERNQVSGLGLAYGTSDPDHLLNVRAGQMGAFADDPGHFWRWVQSHLDIIISIPDISEQSFIPRLIFGRYLRDILAESRKVHPQFEALNCRIVNVRRLSTQDFELVVDDGQTLTANRVVLALGNFPPDQFSATANTMNPYTPATWQKLADKGDVLIVGTGLTSLDLVVTLAKTKPSGVIHLLSRHGLLPREHVDIKPYTLRLKAPYPTTALGLCRAVRKEIANVPDVSWQSVVDALRPLNQILWQSLDLGEQRRFLRHLRSYWDVHRHRCASKVMDAYRGLEQKKRLILHHGSIVEQTPCEEGWTIIWRPRGKTVLETLTVRHVVRCTGPQADFRKLDDELVQNLLKSNLITPDALRLGLASIQNYAVCDRDGHKIEGLYALGSLLKGKLYESVAVPELRAQAMDVAHLIAQDIGQTC